MKVIKEKHAFLMRWTHWVNFPVLAVMIWSGLFIYWANDAYGISIFGFTIIKFFPEWFYNYFLIPQRLAEGMAFHFLFMWFFFINGLLYILYTIFSGAWRGLLPNKHSFNEAWMVLLHDLHIRKMLPPQKKYNAAQRIAYSAIILMGFGSMFTGLAIYKPVIIAGWNNFRSVISGFEVIEEPIQNQTETVVLKKTEESTSAFASWKWLLNAPEETSGITGGARAPLRRALNKTELFFRNFFSNNHLVKTYPKSRAATKVRINSLVGIEDDINFDAKNWKLSVKRKNQEDLKISIEEIKSLPKTEIIYDFKCVEGWDQIQHWAGVKLSDFLLYYKLEEQAKSQYMGLETPNGEYYVGLEMDSVLHPQTLLAYEMNEMPLTIDHGAPLRLIVPVKYGIKNLKRIGTISFSNSRPRDYWAEQGYDYYS
eukprot:gene13676-16646_t